jgi:hypothetical protein
VPIRQLRFANTTLQIVGSGGRPQTVDNTFNVPANSVDFSLPVLANDVELSNPPLTITAVGTATSTTFVTPNGGRVTIASDGQRLLYTPRTGFSGTEQFTYTAANSVGLTSSAVVTVQVGSVPKDVSFRLDTTNQAGQHIDLIQTGENFQIRVFVQDVRANPPDPTRMGVFAAYLDLLYNSALVSTIGDINTPFGFRMEFGPQYTNGQSASNALPNIIDELGAFQQSFSPLGPSEFLLASITLRANAAGVAEFTGDPANITPLHDVLLFEPADDEVDLSRIGYRSTSIVIVGAGGVVGEGEFHNKSNKFDVNTDREVTPIDALLVINDLNNLGPRALAAAGEGESGRKYVDVNGDGQISPIDALQIVNHLNALSRGIGGEGEAYVDAGPGLTDSSTAIATLGVLALTDTVSVGPPLRTSTVVSSTTVESSAASVIYPTAEDRDRVFAGFTGTGDSDSDSAAIDSLLAEDILDGWVNPMTDE